jgi:hypothetical protein
MRSLLWLGLACAAWLGAQAFPDDEAGRARAGVERLRELVEAGAAPRARLERAEADLADAEDAGFLRRTLYGPELTEDQIEPMLAAASRRVERRREAVAHARRLVEEKVASLSSVTPRLEELDRARKEADMAESRAHMCRELTAIARLEQEYQNALEAAPAARPLPDRFDGSGVFTIADLAMVDAAFRGQFGKPLPVSALGDTAVHRSLGFDHRDRVDVAVHPDQPEGVWLLRYLESRRIPYFAFRQALRGRSTGAHIHIGPVSTRLARTNAAAAGGGS